MEVAAKRAIYKTLSFASVTLQCTSSHRSRSRPRNTAITQSDEKGSALSSNSRWMSGRPIVFTEEFNFDVEEYDLRVCCFRNQMYNTMLYLTKVFQRTMSLSVFMVVAPHCVCVCTDPSQSKLWLQTHHHRLDKYAHHHCWSFYILFCISLIYTYIQICTWCLFLVMVENRKDNKKLKWLPTTVLGFINKSITCSYLNNVL